MVRINDILDTIVDYNVDADLHLVERAYIYSAQVHDGQMRLSGEPYLSHPLAVAFILAKMKLDVESIAAGLLHDVIEDTHATKDDIQRLFGSNISRIVEGVTKLSKLKFSDNISRQAESLRKMILAMADDIRVVLIKLADRLHNMRTLNYQKPERQKAIARETLDIYAPIAARLGIFWLKQELEDVSFYYSMPDEYKTIDILVNKARDEKEAYVKEVMEKLQSKLSEEGIQADIKGRFKQHYSIYHKMLSQNLEFNQIYDLVAFRIILDKKAQCYEVMGIIHDMWKPIHYKFKDYIGVPKQNGYQSLHTTVIGPHGERVEIQLRTHDMDEVAESGIAAHWSYKEGASIDEQTGKTFAWLRNLVDNQKESSDPDEFLENVRIDLYPDEIYVFTPDGDIKTLPKGATPVDFAYMIHTEVGDQCISAKVNGKIVPLNHKLETGNSVSIITAKDHHPTPDWLNFVVTVKARSKIKHWINAQEKERSISLGKEMCEKLFRKKGYSFNAMVKSGALDAVAESFSFREVDDLIAHVGFGKITPLQLFHRVVPDAEKENEKIEEREDKLSSILGKLIGTKRKRRKSNEGVIVKGLDDILVKFSKCCNPLPGDDIIGYITQGQGVTVHRKGCLNTLQMSPERKIEVEWGDDYKDSYPTRIRIRANDRAGLLADVATTISKNKANIINAQTETSDFGAVKSYFTVSVSSIEQLQKVMSELRKLKSINDVKRIDTME